jgi:hypothetical protein
MNNNTSAKVRKEEVVACLQVLFQALSGLSGENHEGHSEMSVTKLKFDGQTSKIRRSSDNGSKAKFDGH